MRGLDSDERRVLEIIAARDYSVGDAEYASLQGALRRCADRHLYLMVVEYCPNCGSVHEMPVLTAEGKTAIDCDKAARTLEL